MTKPVQFISITSDGGRIGRIVWSSTHHKIWWDCAWPYGYFPYWVRKASEAAVKLSAAFTDFSVVTTARADKAFREFRETLEKMNDAH